MGKSTYFFIQSVLGQLISLIDDNIISRNSKKHYEIFDLQGKLMKSGKTDENYIDISEFANGVYILILRMPNKITKQAKIIKI